MVAWVPAGHDEFEVAYGLTVHSWADQSGIEP